MGFSGGLALRSDEERSEDDGGFGNKGSAIDQPTPGLSTPRNDDDDETRSDGIEEVQSHKHKLTKKITKAENNKTLQYISLEEAHSSLAEKDKELSQLYNSLQEAQKSLTEKDKELSELRSELEFSEKRIQEIESELDSSAEKEHAKAQLLLSEALPRKEELEVNLKSMNEQHGESKAVAEEANGKNHELEGQILVLHAAEQQIKLLKHQVQQEAASSAEKGKRLEEALNNAEEYKEKLNELQSSLDSSTSKIQLLEQEVKDLTDRFSQHQGSDGIEEVQYDKHKLIKEIEAHISLTEEDKELSELRSELDELQESSEKEEAAETETRLCEAIANNVAQPDDPTSALPEVTEPVLPLPQTPQRVECCTICLQPVCKRSDRRSSGFEVEMIPGFQEFVTIPCSHKVYVNDSTQKYLSAKTGDDITYNISLYKEDVKTIMKGPKWKQLLQRYEVVAEDRIAFQHDPQGKKYLITIFNKHGDVKEAANELRRGSRLAREDVEPKQDSGAAGNSVED